MLLKVLKTFFNALFHRAIVILIYDTDKPLFLQGQKSVSQILRYGWRTQKCRNLCLAHAFFFG